MHWNKKRNNHTYTPHTHKHNLKQPILMAFQWLNVNILWKFIYLFVYIAFYCICRFWLDSFFFSSYQFSWFLQKKKKTKFVSYHVDRRTHKEICILAIFFCWFHLCVVLNDHHNLTIQKSLEFVFFFLFFNNGLIYLYFVKFARSPFVFIVFNC